jgi:hypothetical protein
MRFEFEFKTALGHEKGTQVDSSDEKKSKIKNLKRLSL